MRVVDRLLPYLPLKYQPYMMRIRWENDEPVCISHRILGNATPHVSVPGIWFLDWESFGINNFLSQFSSNYDSDAEGEGEGEIYKNISKLRTTCFEPCLRVHHQVVLETRGSASRHAFPVKIHKEGRRVDKFLTGTWSRGWRNSQ